MAYAGTETTTYIHNGKVGVLYNCTDFDADTETSAGFDSWATGNVFNAAAFLVSRTAGSTDVISFKVQGSFDNAIWEDTGMAVTAKDTYDYFPLPDFSGSADYLKTFRYWRFVCTTVGSGNTLDADLWLYKH